MLSPEQYTQWWYQFACPTNNVGSSDSFASIDFETERVTKEFIFFVFGLLNRCVFVIGKIFRRNFVQRIILTLKGKMI